MNITTEDSLLNPNNMSSMCAIPGDTLNHLINEQQKYSTILGPGIRKDRNQMICCKAGLLKIKKSPDAYWIDSVQKRYVPSRGERVLGIVGSKGAFTVKVDIGTSDSAVLNLLAFEGATKKNRPDVNFGDVVFARVLTAGKDIETELVCVTSRGKKEGLGILPIGGYMINVPVHVIRKLLNPESELLDYLGIKFKFESAIGLNGRIWIKAASVQSTLLIANIFKKLEHTDEKEIIEELKL